MFCLYATDSEEYYSTTSVVCVSSDKAKLEERIEKEEASYKAALAQYLLYEQINKRLKEIVETLPKNCMKMPAPLRKVKGNMTREEHKQYKNEKDAYDLLMREYSDSRDKDLGRRQEETILLYCLENNISVESLERKLLFGFNWKPEENTFHIEEVEEI